MDQLIEYTPSILTFFIELRKQSVASLHLTNISDGDIAYKIKTTQLKRYCVRPNAAILRVGQSIDVELVQQACKTVPDDIHDCKDKFLLQVVRLDQLDILEPTVQEVWKCALTESIFKTKFLVSLQMQSDDIASPSQPSASESVSVAPPSAPILSPPAPALAPIAPAISSDSPAASFSPAVESPHIGPPTRATPSPPSPAKSATLVQSPKAFSSEKPPLPSSSGAPSIPVAALSPASVTTAAPGSTYATTATATTVAAPAPAAPASAPAPVPTASHVNAHAHTPLSPVPGSSQTTPLTADAEPAPKPKPAASSTTKHPPTAEPVPESVEDSEVDYASVEYARERALGIRTAPQISLASPERSSKQRIAVERAGELVRVINMRQGCIDALNKELAEAKHKLSDAQMAVRPAYDVRYEVNESGRVPFAQICLMAIISGALLQFLV